MAFPQLQTVNLDTLISTTLQNLSTKLVDNVIKVVPAARLFMDEKGRRTAGGTRIYAPLLYGYNQTTTWFNQSDYIDLSPQEAVTAAQYKWANLVSAITIFGEEEMANAGDAEIVDFAEAKIKQAELSMARQLNQSAYGDGTAFFGAAPDGLSNIVFLNPSAAPADPPGGAVGGISAVTFPFWRNNFNATGAAYSANGSMGSSSPDYQLRMYHTCSDGAIRASAILSDYTIFEDYHINGKGEYRMLDNDVIDLGFEHTVYKGIPWYPDRDCPALTQYVVNTEYLYAYVDPNRFFKTTDWMPTLNQDGKVLRIHLRMNYVCTNRMLQGVLSWTS
jgi:hypothetical protein